MKTKLVTATTGMLISLDEAKAHLRVDHTVTQEKPNEYGNDNKRHSDKDWQYL